MVEIKQDNLTSRIYNHIETIHDLKIDKLESITNQYLDRVESIFTRVEKSNQKMIDVVAKEMYKFANLNVYAIDAGANISNKIIDAACSFAMSTYWLARHTTIFSPIWLYVYKKMKNYNNNYFMIPGIHFIVALPGGGKSSIIYDITDELRYRTGKSAYVNVEMEIPFLDKERMIYTVNRRLFEVEDFFGIDYDEQKGKYIATQLKQFDTNHFNCVVMDEWLANNNHRQNKTNDYNNKVIPLITFFARMRHGQIPYVYIASQIDTTDNQIMSFFKFIHEVEIVRDIPFRKWIKDGLFEQTITGWKVFTYGFKRGKNGIEKVLIADWFKPKFSEEFERFNSLNQAHIFEDMKKDSVNIRKVGYR